MRLIDADKIQYAKDWVVTDKIPKVGGYNAKAIYRVTKEEIDAMPTVDAVIVKHGRWIPVDSYSAFGGDESTWMAHGNPIAYYYCSECKNQAYADEFGDSLLTKFCPDCGADMRKDCDKNG